MDKQSKQSPGPQKAAAANLEGNTSRHTDNTKPDSIGSEGNAAPGKHKRGPQG